MRISGGHFDGLGLRMFQKLQTGAPIQHRFFFLSGTEIFWNQHSALKLL